MHPRKIPLVSLCFILFIFGGFTAFVHGNPDTTSQDDIHPTIHISGNADLLQQAADNGWTGTGTSEDPIVIQGYRFLSDIHIFTIAHTDLYVNFTNNWVEGMHHTWCSLVISLTKNVIVCNNTIFGGAIGVHLIAANDTLVTRNTIYDTRYDGVFMDNGCTGNIITENYFSDNDETGVMAWTGCTKNTISNNFIQYSDNGVNFLTDANENDVINNTIVDARLSGVDLDTVNNVVRDNRIVSCNGDGIRVFKPDNELVGNQIIESRYRGIFIAPNGNNTDVLHNSFVNNTQESILIMDGSRNIIKYNDFLGESERAYASDNGYLNIFEMNYWEGFLSTDSNHDGVFDTPYDIDGHAQNRDFYPATNTNNPMPSVSEEPDEITDRTSTSTTVTSTETNDTIIQDDLGLQYMLLAGAAVVLVPIVAIVSYYYKRSK
ncbi:MAG: right-handed parallel beta-helix repeat-containing protein [Candidatus Thorarchaeota archaeon]